MLRRDLTILLAITFAFPVVLAIVFFPTPAIDLREHINWGLHFPLQTPKHPPLQSWLAGLVALTSVRDAWPYVLLTQVLNGVSLFYLVRITAEFIDRQAVVAVTIAFCGTVSASAAVLTGALNADHIQAPFWLGLLYHALRAARDDNWRDWSAGGLFAGMAILAKYSAAVFILVLALALVVNRPALVRRPGPYLAAMLGMAVAAVNIVPEIGHPMAFEYADSMFGAALPQRLRFIVNYALSFAAYTVPLLLALAWLWRRGDIIRVRVARGSAAATIVTATAMLLILLLALVVIGGNRYHVRYSIPAVPLCLLALFCLIRLKSEAFAPFARFSLSVWCGVLIGALAYALIFINSYIREPADAAAAAIRADWQRQFRCGPAYVIGAKRAAHGVGLYYGQGVVGVSTEDYRLAPWVSSSRLAERGAILIDWSDSPNAVIPDLLRAAGPEKSLHLPYRRTWRQRLHNYRYRFVPPGAC